MIKKKQRRKSDTMIKKITNQGVTLIELLAVIVIIGIIATVAVLTINGLIERQRIKAAQASFEICITVANNYVFYESLETNETFTSADLVTEDYLDSDPFDEIVTFTVGENGTIMITSPSDPTINGITANAEFYALWIEVYATELFISEYVEGIGDNKAIEIFNGTGETVQLAGYTLRIYFGGSTTTFTSITLTGSIAHNDVYIVASPTLYNTLLIADLSSAKLTFNGDDVVVLVHDGIFLDVIGKIGEDIDEQWGTGFTSTQDNTLVRNEAIIVGDSDGSDTFTPSEEWIGYAGNTFGNLGTHLCNVTEEPKS
jgi:prepilin-type N-terminal cleavage/methylation domain-containing protein